MLAVEAAGLGSDSTQMTKGTSEGYAGVATKRMPEVGGEQLSNKAQAPAAFPGAEGADTKFVPGVQQQAGDPGRSILARSVPPESAASGLGGVIESDRHFVTAADLDAAHRCPAGRRDRHPGLALIAAAHRYPGSQRIKATDQPSDGREPGTKLSESQARAAQAAVPQVRAVDHSALATGDASQVVRAGQPASQYPVAKDTSPASGPGPRSAVRPDQSAARRRPGTHAARVDLRPGQAPGSERAVSKLQGIEHGGPGLAANGSVLVAASPQGISRSQMIATTGLQEPSYSESNDGGQSVAGIATPAQEPAHAPSHASRDAKQTVGQGLGGDAGRVPVIPDGAIAQGTAETTGMVVSPPGSPSFGIGERGKPEMSPGGKGGGYASAYAQAFLAHEHAADMRHRHEQVAAGLRFEAQRIGEAFANVSAAQLSATAAYIAAAEAERDKLSAGEFAKKWDEYKAQKEALAIYKANYDAMNSLWESADEFDQAAEDWKDAEEQAEREAAAAQAIAEVRNPSKGLDDELDNAVRVERRLQQKAEQRAELRVQRPGFMAGQTVRGSRASADAMSAMHDAASHSALAKDPNKPKAARDLASDRYAAAMDRAAGAVAVASGTVGNIDRRVGQIEAPSLKAAARYENQVQSMQQDVARYKAEQKKAGDTLNDPKASEQEKKAADRKLETLNKKIQGMKVKIEEAAKKANALRDKADRLGAAYKNIPGVKNALDAALRAIATFNAMTAADRAHDAASSAESAGKRASDPTATAAEREQSEDAAARYAEEAQEEADRAAEYAEEAGTEEAQQAAEQAANDAASVAHLLKLCPFCKCVPDPCPPDRPHCKCTPTPKPPKPPLPPLPENPSMGQAAGLSPPGAANAKSAEVPSGSETQSAGKAGGGGEKAPHTVQPSGGEPEFSVDLDEEIEHAMRRGFEGTAPRDPGAPERPPVGPGQDGSGPTEQVAGVGIGGRKRRLARQNAGGFAAEEHTPRGQERPPGSQDDQGADATGPDAAEPAASSSRPDQLPSRTLQQGDDDQKQPGLQPEPDEEPEIIERKGDRGQPQFRLTLGRERDYALSWDRSAADIRNPDSPKPPKIYVATRGGRIGWIYTPDPLWKEILAYEWTRRNKPDLRAYWFNEMPPLGYFEEVTGNFIQSLLTDRDRKMLELFVATYGDQDLLRIQDALLHGAEVPADAIIGLAIGIALLPLLGGGSQLGKDLITKLGGKKAVSALIARVKNAIADDIARVSKKTAAHFWRDKVKKDVANGIRKALIRNGLLGDALDGEVSRAMRRLDGVFGKLRKETDLQKEMDGIIAAFNLSSDALAEWRRAVGRIHHVIPQSIDTLSAIPLGGDAVTMLISHADNTAVEKYINQTLEDAMKILADRNKMSSDGLKKALGSPAAKAKLQLLAPDDLRKLMNYMYRGHNEMREAAGVVWRNTDTIWRAGTE